MKTFLTLTAFLEGTTGLILFIAPSFIFPILLSTQLEEKGGVIAARIAGIAIICLAINSWFSKNDKKQSGIMISLLVYNFTVIAIFGYAGIAYGLSGLFLWLVVAGHSGLGLWGVILMRKKLS
jgi:hypothetical protein